MNSSTPIDPIPQLFQALRKILSTDELYPLICRLVATGHHEQALQLTHLLPNNYQRGNVQIKIASTYASNNQTRLACQLLDQVLNDANAPDFVETVFTGTSPELLAEVAAQYVLLGDTENASRCFDQAIQRAQTIEDGLWNGDHQLKIIAQLQAKVGLVEQALQVVQTKMWSNTNKDEPLAAIASSYLATGQLEQALQVAISINHGYIQAPVLAEVAIKYADVGQPDAATDVFKQVIEAIKRAGEGLADGSLQSLLWVVRKYLNAERYDKAFELIDLTEEINKLDKYSMTDTSLRYKIEALSELTSKAQSAGRREIALAALEQACKANQKISERGKLTKIDSQAKIALAYAAIGQYSTALREAETIYTIKGSDDITNELSQGTANTTIAEIALQAAMAGDLETSYKIVKKTKLQNKLQISIAELLADLAIQYKTLNKQSWASQFTASAIRIALQIDDGMVSTNPVSSLIEMIGIQERGTLFDPIAYDLQSTFSNQKRKVLISIVIKYVNAAYWKQSLQLVEIILKLDQANQLIYQGEQLYGLVKFDEAINCWQEARKIGKQFGDFELINSVSSYLEVGNLVRKNHAKLLKTLVEIHQIKTIQEPSEAIRIACISLTTPYYQTSDYSKGLEVGEQILNSSRQESDLHSLGLALLGVTYNMLGNSEKALTYMEQYQCCSNKSKDSLTNVVILNELGVAYLSLGNLEKAIVYLKQASKIAKKTSDELEISCLTSVAYAYVIQGNTSEAANIFVNLYFLLGFRSAVGITKAFLRNLSSNLLARRFELPSLNESISMKTEKNTAHFLLPINSGVGIMQSMSGKHHEAIQTFMKNLDFVGKIYSSGKWEQAIMAASSSSTHSADVYLVNSERATILAHLSTAFVNAGSLKEAISCLRQTIEVWNELLRNSIKNDNPKVLFFEKYASLYRLLQKILIEQGSVNAALEVAEEGRTRAFVDLLVKRTYLKQEVPDVNLKERLSIFTQQSLAQQQGMIHAVMTEAPSVEKIQTIAKQQNATIVEYSIIYKGDTDFRIPGWQTHRSTELLIWIIQPDGNIVFRQVDLEPLQQQGTSLADLVTIARKSIGVKDRAIERNISIYPEDFIEEEVNQSEQLKQLYQLLIQPIADLLPVNKVDRVIFIPQGVLFLVPFPALQDASGTYLIERHTLLTAPSIQVLDIARKQKQKHKGITFQEALVMGNPTMPIVSFKDGSASYQLEPLPGAEQEAEVVARLLQTQAVTGNQATKAVFLQKASNARVIHLATHGLLDNVEGLGSSIALAPSKSDNGLLTAQEILDLELSAELVVLSACNTGRGRISSDGIVGLSRSLILAGATSVLVSLWSVPDAPTSSLMSEFYQQLQIFSDKAQALRQAMLKTKEHHPNPRDWAAFTLIGESDSHPHHV